MESGGTQGFEEFEFKHVKTDVVAEQRVYDVEFRCVQELQDLPPETGDDACGRDDAEEDAQQDACFAQFFRVRVLQLIAALAQKRFLQGGKEGPHEERHDDDHGDAHLDLRKQLCKEHRHVAGLPEPQQVRQKTRKGVDEYGQQDQYAERDA